MALGVSVIERDESLYTNNSQANPCLAIVGTATKGPIGVPTLCINQRDLRNKFGLQNPNCLGLYAANYMLSEVNRCYYVRVAKDAVESTVDIPGTNGDATIEDLITLKAATPGTSFDGYSIIIEDSTVDGFTFSIRDNNNIILSTYVGASLDATSDKYIGKTLESDPYVKLSAISESGVSYILEDGIYDLSGGDNGITGLTSSEYIDGLGKLIPDTLNVELICTPGVTDASVIQKGLSVAETRGDSIYFVDPPEGLDYEAAVAWHNGSGDDNHAAFNSSYGVMYWSWQYIYDSINDVEVLVPPSVVVPPTFARSDAMAVPWYSPAGLTRGLLKNVIRSEFVPDSDATDLMYTDPNNVNPIITHANSGLAVFGQKTLYRQPVSLNRVNVRRLVTYIKHAAKDICQYLVFEPNDSTSWNAFQDLMDPILRGIKHNRGLYEYKIVKGDDIITDSDIDNYRMPVQILIKPTKSAEYIPVDIVLVSTGTELDTYESIYNG